MPIHRPPTWKPPQGTPLASNALTRGLVFAAVFNEGSGVPWAWSAGGGYAQPDAGIAGTPSWAAGPSGLAYRLTSAGLAYSASGAAAAVQAATALTVLWQGTPDQATRSDLVSQWGGASSNYRFVLGAGIVSGCFGWYSGVIPWQPVTSAPYTVGREYTCVGTLAATAGSQQLWVDGVSAGTDTGVIGPATTTPMRIGTDPDVSTGDFGTSLVLIWARVLSAAEIAAIGGPNAIWPMAFEERPYYRLLRAVPGRPTVYDYLARRRRAV